MSRKESETPVPTPTSDRESGTPQRSGSGANTALVAMLKKRLMRATHDNEPEPDAAGEKTSSE